MATAAKPRLLTAEEFLAIVWDDPDAKAELDRGVIRIMRMMAGGNADHSRVQGNVFAALRVRLRGTGCRPHGPDMAVRINDYSIRYPDVSVYCGKDAPEDGKKQAFDDPKLLVEVLSSSTRTQDFEVKLPEYMSLPSVDAILFIDPDVESVRLWQRVDGRLREASSFAPGDTVELTSLSIDLSWNDIFSRD
jgi:Uma2 family endonuclease